MKSLYILFKRRIGITCSVLIALTMLISGAFAYAKASRFLAQQAVTYELARKVAAYYANIRWDNAHIGQDQLYCAPDGTPEVYFFVVFKKGIPERSKAELLSEVAVLRNRRIRIQKALESVPETREATVKNLWRQMSAPDKYGTVVIGAHEGREPFIASYNGLPPHIFLREDAIETRRRQIRGKYPGEPKYVWQPPLFVAFEFLGTEEKPKNVFFEVRGTKFTQIDTQFWKAAPVPDKVLLQRKQKWQSWRAALSEN